MDAIKVELLILDFDGLDSEEIKDVIENQRYPNHCISPNVMSIERQDVGEFNDDHPLNLTDKMRDEFQRIFHTAANGTPPTRRG